MFPSLTILQAKDYQRVPWKNGQGLTTEIFSYPPEGSFLWRLSRADVKESGPFSDFPGIDRTIVQLSGPDLILKHGDGRHVALKHLNPYSFDGDWQTEAVVSGPSEDFNVMLRQGCLQAITEGYPAHKLEKSLTCLGEFLVIYVVKGSLHCNLDEELAVELDAQDTLLMPCQKDQQLPIHGAKDTEVIAVHLFKL